MYKLDFSEIQSNGFRIKQLRLVYSPKFRGNNFHKNKRVYKDTDDLRGEKDFMIEYLIENSEIDYTLFNLFFILSIVLGIVSVGMIVVTPTLNLTFRLTPIILSIICFLWSRRKRSEFILGNMGIDWTETIYNVEIKEKYNL